LPVLMLATESVMPLAHVPPPLLPDSVPQYPHAVLYDEHPPPVDDPCPNQ
jgi:hypothetical protein